MNNSVKNILIKHKFSYICQREVNYAYLNLKDFKRYLLCKVYPAFPFVKKQQRLTIQLI